MIFDTTTTVLVVLIILCLIGAGFFFWTSKSKKKTVEVDEDEDFDCDDDVDAAIAAATADPAVTPAPASVPTVPAVEPVAAPVVPANFPEIDEDPYDKDLIYITFQSHRLGWNTANNELLDASGKAKDVVHAANGWTIFTKDGSLFIVSEGRTFLLRDRRFIEVFKRSGSFTSL